MHLHNPTKNEVGIVLKGVTYSVPAGGTVEVSNEVGEHWLLTHQFLRSEEAVVTPPYQGNNQTVIAKEASAPKKKAVKE
jgi:hypothetical protein